MFEILYDPNNIPFWVIIIGVIAGAIAVISRPFSTYVKFVYPNAKFEAMGNPFIGEKELESIIDSKNISSFKETISTHKEYKITGEDVYEVQKSLDDTLIQTISMMKHDSSKKMHSFFDTYLEKLDIHLVKTMVKQKIEGKEIDIQLVEQAILPETRQLLNKIIETEKNNLSLVLKDQGYKEEDLVFISDEQFDPLKIDIVFDKYFIDKLKNIQVPYKCEQGKQKFVKTLVDIINIKNLLRAKQLKYDTDVCKNLYIGEGREIPPWKYEEMSDVDSVPQVISSLEGTSYFNVLKDNIERYNKERSVQILEIALDVLLLKIVGDISTQNYVTIGPTIRFLISKEFEIRNLKIIAKGISENLSPEHIKDFLVWEVNQV